MKTPSAPTQETLDRLKALVGPKGWQSDPADLSAYLSEPRDRWTGHSPLMLSPASTQEVANIVRLCAETKTALVPQGGNTGLVGGQIPKGEILLSTRRLKTVRAIDPLNNSLTAEAGCILADLHEKAKNVDRLLPLSLASEGSARIGGLVSTNAGGVAVLRYGPMRDLVLGLEVVTPQGDIWDGLSALRKDNTGYDLKQLFIGAEGTLGIITTVTCKLFPRPKAHATAFVAVKDVTSALSLLSETRAANDDLVSAFELVPGQGLDFVLTHIPGTQNPFTQQYEWYVLIETSSSQAHGNLSEMLETQLGQALDQGLALDAVVANSEAQRKSLWALRENVSEAQRHEGISFKHDISVPISAIPEFLDKALHAVTQAIPGMRPVPFGHLGDGNLHFNFSQPKEADPASLETKRKNIAKLVNDIVQSFGGSISAEHGIGVDKRDELAKRKSPIEMAMMKAIKKALDPNGIMNPGKIL